MVHYAKVDLWLAALLGGSGLVCLACGIGLLAGLIGTSESRHEALIGGVALLFSSALMGLALWGCYATRYEIGKSDLIVRFGPFVTRVPLESIDEVLPTRNPLSAPAPSLRRLRVNYRTAGGGHWFALISPKDREQFVRDLAGAVPHLRRASGEPLRLVLTQTTGVGS